MASDTRLSKQRAFLYNKITLKCPLLLKTVEILKKVSVAKT